MELIKIKGRTKFWKVSNSKKELLFDKENTITNELKNAAISTLKGASVEDYALDNLWDVGFEYDAGVPTSGTDGIGIFEGGLQTKKTLTTTEITSQSTIGKTFRGEISMGSGESFTADSAELWQNFGTRTNPFATQSFTAITLNEFESLIAEWTIFI